MKELDLLIELVTARMTRALMDHTGIKYLSAFPAMLRAVTLRHTRMDLKLLLSFRDEAFLRDVTGLLRYGSLTGDLRSSYRPACYRTSTRSTTNEVSPKST